MINNKNSKVERKIIDDHINIQGTEISIKLHVNNWGEAFDPRLLKKRIEQSIQESGVEVQDIKNIEATLNVLPLSETISNEVIEIKPIKKLTDNLQKFLLELGKGFSFVAKQFKITIDNEHNFIDLVFYHRILKCFVLIDLKTRKVKHQDIGQMNLYLNYFKEEENIEGDHEPIGIIITADKHDLLVKYATGGLSNKIFVSKYQLYLPDQKVLEEKVKEILENE